MIIVILGVSGVGKTTVGRLLAKDLGWKFYDADDLHSVENIAKMRSGTPLNDQDRHDWLHSLHELISQTRAKNEDAVLACSALKRVYRQLLFVDQRVKGALLHSDFSTIEQRMKRRRRHFMNPDLLKSQFETLEMPDSEENILILDASRPIRELIRTIKRSLI